MTNCGHCWTQPPHPSPWNWLHPRFIHSFVDYIMEGTLVFSEERSLICDWYSKKWRILFFCAFFNWTSFIHCEFCELWGQMWPQISSYMTKASFALCSFSSVNQSDGHGWAILNWQLKKIFWLHCWRAFNCSQIFLVMFTLALLRGSRQKSWKGSEWITGLSGAAASPPKLQSVHSSSEYKILWSLRNAEIGDWCCCAENQFGIEILYPWQQTRILRGEIQPLEYKCAVNHFLY